MKFKRLRISPELLFLFFAAGDHPGGYRVTSDAIPEDAKLRNACLGWPTCIELLIESQEFPEVEEGAEIPFIIPTAERYVPVGTVP